MKPSEISIADFHAEIEHYIIGTNPEVSMIAAGMVILMCGIKREVADEKEARDTLNDILDMDAIERDMPDLTSAEKKHIQHNLNEISIIMEDKFNEIVWG